MEVRLLTVDLSKLEFIICSIFSCVTFAFL